MEAKAYLKYARISPRKVKIVLDLIRGKDAGTAIAVLADNLIVSSPQLATEFASPRRLQLLPTFFSSQ